VAPTERGEGGAVSSQLGVEVGLAADALAVSDAGLLDAHQDEARLGRDAVKQRLDAAAATLRDLHRIAAQPGDEEHRRQALAGTPGTGHDDAL
jgi:hypothetical protein